jgi:hypothetical protein
VIVNQPCPRWVEPLRARDALLCVVEPFRSEQSRILLRLNGEQPRLNRAVLSRCTRTGMARMIVVESPAMLDGEHDTRYDIEFEGTVAVWVRVEMADVVYLRPVRGDVLAGATAVDLVRLDDGRLEFRQPR